MNHADAADQIVNMGLKGVEVVSNIAGKGALSLATFLIAAMKDQKRTKGKARMQAFRGKPTKVFVIKRSELSRFAEEAKRYGVLYAAVINRKNPDGVCDIIVNAGDAAKVNRIAERFELSTVDVEKIREDIRKAKEASEKGKAGEGVKERTAPPTEKEAYTVDEETLNEMMKKEGVKKTEQKQPADKTDNVNPTMTRKAKSNPSELSSDSRSDTERATNDRTSVRQQIKDIKKERRAKPGAALARSKTRQTQHKQTTNRKKESKGR